jgi:hypothetical protein
MTLIIKELIIRGIVTKENSTSIEEAFNKEELLQYLEEMQKSIKKECIEKVMFKLESKKIR